MICAINHNNDDYENGNDENIEDENDEPDTPVEMPALPQLVDEENMNTLYKIFKCRTKIGFQYYQKAYCQ